MQTVISGNQFLSGPGYGIQVQNNVSYLTITGNNFHGNGLDGIYFNLSSGNTTWRVIANNIFRNNGGQNLTAGFSAMRFNTAPGATVGHFTVTGNVTRDDQATPSQWYGMNFGGSGSYNNFTIAGNDFSGNKVGAFNFAVAPTLSIIGPNQEDTSGNSQLRTPIVVGNGATVRRALMGTGTLTFTSIAASSCQEQTLTVAGAATSNAVWASPQTSTLGNSNLSWSARVSSGDTVAVRVCNVTTGALTPSAVSWTAWVLQ